MKRFSPSTRKIHTVVRDDGRVDHLEVEHAASGRSVKIDRPLIVTFKNKEPHENKHGCQDLEEYTFSPGAVKSYFDNNKTEAIADGSYVFLINKRTRNKKDDKGRQYVNTGGTVAAIRKDVHEEPTSEWAGSVLAGIAGYEQALARPNLELGKMIWWQSDDIWKGVDHHVADTTPAAGWSTGLF